MKVKPILTKVVASVLVICLFLTSGIFIVLREENKKIFEDKSGTLHKLNIAAQYVMTYYDELPTDAKTAENILNETTILWQIDEPKIYRFMMATIDFPEIQDERSADDYFTTPVTTPLCIPKNTLWQKHRVYYLWVHLITLRLMLQLQFGTAETFQEEFLRDSFSSETVSAASPYVDFVISPNYDFFEYIVKKAPNTVQYNDETYRMIEKCLKKALELCINDIDRNIVYTSMGGFYAQFKSEPEAAAKMRECIEFSNKLSEADYRILEHGWNGLDMT